MRTPVLLLLILISISSLAAAPGPADRPALVVILVIDGLRPESITAEVTPNLNRFKTSGVWYTRAHSVFPTVTRVNTASISTGTLPSQHGIVSNAVYLPSLSDKVLSNGDYRNLLSLGKLNGGRVLQPKSLGEYLHAAGIRYVAVSSGSTGNALLLNPTAPNGLGSLINPGFENGARVAFPDSLNTDLLNRYGTIKAEEGKGDVPLIWVERVLREYVLDTLRPQVVINWMGHTDSAQHQFGVGSPQAIAALRLVDQQIGLLLERVRQLKLEGKIDIIVTCDHGFDYEPPADLLAPLRSSGLTPNDVVLDNEGGASLFYVKGRDPEKIARLVTNFQANPNTNAIFVASRLGQDGSSNNGDSQKENPPCAPGAVKGFAPGTFALELIGLCHPSRRPDIVVTFKWDTTRNPFGVPGTQWIPGESTTAGNPQQTARNGHGGLNPYVTHSTLIAAGPDFKQGTVVDLPAGNQDIAPTVLALQQIAVPADLDGRILSEALKKPPSKIPRPLKSSTRTIQVTTGNYCAELDVSYAGEHAYWNHARRCAAKR